jgi:hypothetical protein
MNLSAPGRDTSLDVLITVAEAPMPDYGTGSFIIANIADANLVPGIAWDSGDGGTRYGDQSPASFLVSGDPGIEEQVYSKTLTFTQSTTTPGLDGTSIPAWLLNQSNSEPGHRLFVGNLSYHHSDPLEPDGQVNYSSGDTLTHQYVVTSIAHAATGNDNPDVLIFVDDVVGGDASRQLGRFVHTVNEDDVHNEVDVGGKFYARESAGVSVLEFSVENFPNNSPSPAPGESASLQGFGIDRGHMGRSFDLVFPTQTAFPEVSGLKIEQDVIEFSPDQAVSVIAIIAPVDLNEVDVGHADLLFSENAPGGAGCSVYICGQNSPQASPEPVTHAGWGHFEIV